MLETLSSFTRLSGSPDISLLGFTGSRSGMSRRQAEVVMNVLQAVKPSKVFHGDCKGSDQQFDTMCYQDGIWREAYPGMDAKGRTPTRAFCDADVVHEVKPYHERDRLIVQRGTDLLLATPLGSERRYPHSGTWYTVRYAARIGRTIYVVMPNGELDLKWLV